MRSRGDQERRTPSGSSGQHDLSPGRQPRAACLPLAWWREMGSGPRACAGLAVSRGDAFLTVALTYSSGFAQAGASQGTWSILPHLLLVGEDRVLGLSPRGALTTEHLGCRMKPLTTEVQSLLWNWPSLLRGSKASFHPLSLYVMFVLVTLGNRDTPGDRLQVSPAWQF
jgi:hypothetical protein